MLAPLLPVPACTTPTGGHPEAHPRQEIVDAIRYVVDNGCKWRALPSDFPPWKTVYGFFARWAKNGVLEYVRDQLRRQIRVTAGRCARPVTAIIDSQSVKAAETVSRDTRGFDGAKLINGRKRHLIVDAKGLLMTVKVAAADVTDRDAARKMLPELRERNPELTLMWADNGYTGLADWARNDLDLTFEVVKKPPNQVGFKVLPRRWTVERSLSWLMRARRNARDYQRLPEHSEAHITWANITLMSRRLARAQEQRQTAEPSSLAA
ncbi:IS5 family transposase [Actinoplanes sp. CA-030573]|uniref:IS5 family transposase n=1 Tax=Actinoplanes sp. CA-030573 TaxID=3239898 RepID=UPI003D8FBD73